ncbi:hypothetical protein FOL47_011125 [Perkinsus chesapeaki]|uniref:Mycophenolic acid acyl-glucuronide esterase, mitochondrial n=1 Tax=Perkinsus chesapeaki TaxID=330153 RepID=A0A7J6MN71_PERCH|nr:hypothetical protein FOL47_011125 [Perkinsus chesapeaki]
MIPFGSCVEDAKTYGLETWFGYWTSILQVVRIFIQFLGRKAMMLQQLCNRLHVPCKLYNYPNWDCPEQLDYFDMYGAARNALLDVASPQRPAVVLAASMGCHFSLRLALELPDLVAAIVSVGGTFNPGSRWEANDMSDWISVTSPYAADEGVYKLQRKFLSDLRANYIAEFADLLLPVDVVHGTSDESVPVETGEKLAKLLPNAKLYLIEGGDHRLSSDAELKIIESLLERHIHARDA